MKLVTIDQAYGYDFQKDALKRALFEADLAFESDAATMLLFRPSVRLEDLKWVVQVFPSIFDTDRDDSMGYLA